MEEVLEFCGRVLRSPGAVREAARTARATAASDRFELLSAASRACRAHVTLDVALPHAPGADGGLDGAVARELAAAAARLPERQREALALREAVGLTYAEIAAVTRVDPAAIGPLLARARMRLRAELRATEPRSGGCDHRDRALRALARRQDREIVEPGEREWLSDHLSACPSCRHAHAAMLEASVCYRAWKVDPIPLADHPDPVVRVQRLPTPAGEPGEPDAEPPRPAFWSRFRSALAADARR
jgi:hypothetical protein